MITRTLIAAGALVALVGCGAAEARTGTRAINNASGLACNQARRTLEQAVENYTILKGEAPVNEAALVPDYLLMQTPLMDIDATGAVVPQLGGGCG